MPTNAWIKFVNAHGVPVLSAYGFERLRRTGTFLMTWEDGRTASVTFRRGRQVHGGEVSFHIDYAFLVPALFAFFEGERPEVGVSVDFIGHLDHQRSDFRDMAPNLWEFDLDESSKLPEFTVKLDDLCRRLIAVGDDLRLIIRPNDIDPFDYPFTERRRVLGELLASAVIEPQSRR